jgi:NAD(P)-dependent dehydrogenase (short-subunit alcohol dehydrogenase family)
VHEGRVVIVTGAGRGIGRAHALLFASLGASVVVNDLDGQAEAVVAEIEAAGGRAIASTESVTDFEGSRRIVGAALEGFGDLHVLVNNAGSLRDRTLASMTEREFDEVVAVNLKGPFNLTRHAVDHWRRSAKSGVVVDRAVVNTTSGSGLYGNVGQGNYAAAKAGVAALTLVSAMELGRYGVRANCIAPIARTRLTEATPGVGELLQDARFDPANVSPLVVCLAAPSCRLTGEVFALHGGTVARLAGWPVVEELRTKGRWDVGQLSRALDGLPRDVERRRSSPFDGR